MSFADRHHDDRVALWCAAPPGAQQARVAADPEHYFVPPYVGARGWLGVYLDVPLDWDEVADVITDAYRQIAPRHLVALLDAGDRLSHAVRGHSAAERASGEHAAGAAGLDPTVSSEIASPRTTRPPWNGTAARCLGHIPQAAHSSRRPERSPLPDRLFVRAGDLPVSQ